MAEFDDGQNFKSGVTAHFPTYPSLILVSGTRWVMVRGDSRIPFEIQMFPTLLDRILLSG